MSDIINHIYNNNEMNIPNICKYDCEYMYVNINLYIYIILISMCTLR